MGRQRLAGIVACAALALSTGRADAAFHLWTINEVYTNADGSIQYIELTTTSSGQEFLATHTLVANDGAATRTFTFATNVGSGTAGKTIVIATPGFARLSGSVTPDFTLPCGPLFNPSATSITLNFAEGSDVVTIAGANVPKDGDNALLRSNPTSFISASNTPKNYAGTSGHVSLTAGQLTGVDDACNDGLFCNGPETCSAGACNAVAPCAQQCIEATQTCVECINVTHCDDQNGCTDDACNGSNECEHTNNSASCDDGLFCNGADTCSAGSCQNAGDPCGGVNCNEGPDTCADCTGAGDCEDGESCTVDTCTSGQCARTNAADGTGCDTDPTFCNGVGMCSAGVCSNVVEPCDPATETCNEANDACDPTAPHGDAGNDPNPNNDDGGGCCQTNSSPATFTAPGLLLALGLLLGRRRARRRRRPDR
jgi:uncharacterized protein (TIGR03382 family)